MIRNAFLNNAFLNAFLKYQSLTNEGITKFVNSVTKLSTKVEPISQMSFKSLQNSYIAINLSKFSRDDTEWKWLFNNTYMHSLPIHQNLMTNTYSQLHKEDNNLNLIQTYSHPFPQVID